MTPDPIAFPLAYPLKPNRRYRVITVPRWFLAKPKPARNAALTFEQNLLKALYPDFPADTEFLPGQSTPNIYTNNWDVLVTHPSFEEVEDGSDNPVCFPTWDNIRAALLYT